MMRVLLLMVAMLSLVGCNSNSDQTRSVDSEIMPSWNDGPARQAIVNFVSRVTDPEHPDFVPVSARIATFDNDGTLWAEQPLYFQLMYTMDRVHQLVDENPGWRSEQPFKAILENDRETLKELSHRDLFELVLATHAGMTSEEFQAMSRTWLDTTRHPRFDRPLDLCIYQPMVEVLEYLRANGFKTFIASAGGQDFMRAYSEEAYGIPPHMVIGSHLDLEFVSENGKTNIRRMSEILFIDDAEAKPVGIQRFVGQRPIAAFGNSDGDLAMLQYAVGGDTPGLAVLVHHDDAEREYAYDRDSKIGRLDRAWDEALERGWTVISMKNDWGRVFPE